MIVTNPYIGWQVEGEYSGTLVELIEELENKTDLSFMAHSEEGEELHGFVTMMGDDVVVSVYGTDKESNDESPHTFKAVEQTDELTDTIKSVLE